MKRLMTGIIATSVATLGLGGLAALPASASTMTTMHTKHEAVEGLVTRLSLDDLLRVRIGLLDGIFGDRDDHKGDDGKDGRDDDREEHDRNGKCSVELPNTGANDDVSFGGAAGGCWVGSGNGSAEFPGHGH